MIASIIKYNLFFLFFLISFFSNASSVTVISSDTTWTVANSPYANLGEVQIASGVTLTVEAGVTISNTKILSWGNLNIEGSEIKPVVIRDSNLGVKKESESNYGHLNIDHAYITTSKLYNSSPSTSNAAGQFTLTNSTITNSEYVYLWYPTANSLIEGNAFINTGGISIGVSNGVEVNVRNNFFFNQTGDPYDTTGYAIQSWADYDDSKVIVEFNNFISTDRVAVKLKYDADSVIATNNFWGTTAPDIIEQMIHDRNDTLELKGFIEFTPFLDSPHPEARNAFITDLDSDGISDFDEIFNGTDLFNPDTDKDGVIDGEDAFPRSKEASLDKDNDGKPDVFHDSCDIECLENTWLTLDYDINNDGFLDIYEESGSIPLVILEPLKAYAFSGRIIAQSGTLFEVRQLDFEGEELKGQITFADEYLDEGHVAGTDIISSIKVGEYTLYSPIDLAAVGYYQNGLSVHLPPGGALAFRKNKSLYYSGGGDLAINIKGNEGNLSVNLHDKTPPNAILNLQGQFDSVIEDFDSDHDLIIDSIDIDDDNDGFIDEVDAFPTNPAAYLDTDNDGLPNEFNQHCNEQCIANSGLTLDLDDDNDGYTDEDERVNGTDSLDTSSKPADFDGDFISDLMDSDDDNDGIEDTSDAFQFNAAAAVDTDADGMPDDFLASCKEQCIANSGLTLDLDDDNDGYSDEDERANGTDTINANSIPLDTDGDFISDLLDRDDDNDGVEDEKDAFPLDASETSDLDGDGIGDNSDLDIDGDGVSNDKDAFPFDPISEAKDKNRNGLDDEVEQEQELLAVITELSRLQISENATASMTNIEPFIQKALESVMESKGITGISLLKVEEGSLRTSGIHNVVFELSNANGVVAKATFELSINPLISIADRKVISEGRESKVTIHLSGKSITYPVNISYELVDSAGSNNIISDVVSITDGNISEEIQLPELFEGDYSLRLLHVDEDNAVLSDNNKQMLISVKGNTAPVITSMLTQNSKVINLIHLNAESVYLELDVFDLQKDDTHKLSLTLNEKELFQGSLESYEPMMLDVSGLGVGVHKITSELIESNTKDSFKSSDTFYFNVVNELPELSSEDSDGDGIADSQEGFTDSDRDGIADYLDDSSLKPNEQLIGDRVIEVSEGLRITLGETAQKVKLNEARDVTLSIDEYEDSLGYQLQAEATIGYALPIIDFEILDLEIGAVAELIIPLAKPLIGNEVYLKLKEGGELVAFDTSDGSSITTSKSVNNSCSEIDSSSWNVGIVAGNDCIKLSIVDGGLNDDDGQANGKIVDPAVLAILNSAPEIALIEFLEVDESQKVTISAEASDFDNHELSYRWKVISGQNISLEGDTSMTISFVAPSIVTGSENIKLELVVSDGYSEVTSSVVLKVNDVPVQNTAPKLEVRQEVNSVEEGQNIKFIIATSDNDGDELEISLSQLKGSKTITFGDVPLNGELSVLAPEVNSDEDYALEFIVSDGNQSVTKVVTFKVMNKQDSSSSNTPSSTEATSDLGGGGSMAHWLFLMVAIGLYRRRFKHF
ncbi:choice-of-anchor U domain-containing protein [Pseudoalteromonas sp. SS15]|uniref:choice-of-anchor U domain-containing protein n=1 Tax=Pseudoalteromonas sp. SS15 TaxID=3139393 RepID=UPI003BAC4276